MYQDPNDKRWYPATITRLCQEPRSYLITTKQGVQYRKTQAHLKPYHPQGENEFLIQEKHKWRVPCVQNKPSATDLAQSRPKRDINPYHAKGYLQLVPNYAKCDYSHDWSKCSTTPSMTIVT